jgi:hypothetical protein
MVLGIPLGLFVFFLIVFIVMGSFGFCAYCKNFTNEAEHGKFEGGFTFVGDDIEHDSVGNPLSGWRLRLSQISEMIFFPLCYPINKLLGREVPLPPQIKE